MRFAFALSVLVGGAGAAQAACLTAEQTFMSCRIADSENVLRVCFDGTYIFYRYGPADQPPALALSEPVASVAYTPWPGIGRAIWETCHSPMQVMYTRLLPGLTACWRKMRTTTWRCSRLVVFM